jgi:glycosyltransferase involved in cell wall biosynthesis
VAVVVVNWNSLDFLRQCLAAVRKFSPPETKITVVDNSSEDGSRGFLRQSKGVKAVLLPANLGHGHAMDIGFLSSDAEYLVSLDVDAFPISSKWLDKLLDPLNDNCVVSGCEVNRRYVHPCCLAMRKKHFVLRSHTFAANYREEGLGSDAWDCGELISIRERPNIHTFKHAHMRGPGWLGTVWTDLIYHNFYAVRHKYHAMKDDVAIENVIIDGRMKAEDAEAAWKEALEKYAINKK